MRRRIHETEITSSAFAAASAISVAMFLLVLTRTDIRRALSNAMGPPPTPVRETVIFVEPPKPIAVPVPRASAPVVLTPRAPASPTAPASPLIEPRPAPAQARDTSSMSSSQLTPSTRLVMPSSPATPFINPPQPKPFGKHEMTAAERDSNLAANLAAPLR